MSVLSKDIFRFLVSGFWFLVSGFWFLVSGFWFWFVDCHPEASTHQKLETRNQKLIRISLLVIWTPFRRDKFDFDLAFFASLGLVLWRVEKHIFLPQVLCNLAEGSEQFRLLRRQEKLSAGFFAKPSQIFVIGIVDRSRVHPLEVLCAYSEDRHVVSLCHLDRFFQRFLARRVFAIR